MGFEYNEQIFVSMHGMLISKTRSAFQDPRIELIVF